MIGLRGFGPADPGRFAQVMRVPSCPRASAWDPVWVWHHQMGPTILWLAEWLAGEMQLRPGLRTRRWCGPEARSASSCRGTARIRVRGTHFGAIPGGTSSGTAVASSTLRSPTKYPAVGLYGAGFWHVVAAPAGFWDRTSSGPAASVGPVLLSPVGADRMQQSRDAPESAIPVSRPATDRHARTTGTARLADRGARRASSAFRGLDRPDRDARDPSPRRR